MANPHGRFPILNHTFRAKRTTTLFNSKWEKLGEIGKDVAGTVRVAQPAKFASKLWVAAQTHEPERKVGWVAFDDIEINPTTIAGNYELKYTNRATSTNLAAFAAGESTGSVPQLPPQPEDKSGSPVEYAMRTLWRHFIINFKELDAFFPNHVWVTLGMEGQHIKRMASDFYDSMKETKFDRILESPHYTWNDLRALKPINNFSDIGVGCVYCWVYSDFKENNKWGYGSKDVVIYIGQTEDASRRRRSHVNDRDNPSSSAYRIRHYQRARQANFQRMIMLATGKEWSKSKPYRLLLAQTLVCLLETYGVEVISEEFSDTDPDNKTSQPIAIHNHTPGVPSMSGAFDIDHMMHATIITRVAKAAFEECKWKNPTQCSSFVPGGGRCAGTNIVSPLEPGDAEGRDPWVMFRCKTAGGQKLIEFTCMKPKKMGTKPTSGKDDDWPLFSIGDEREKGQNHTEIRVKGTSALRGDEKVYITFEVQVDGPHPYAYARIPRISIWNDGDFGNQLALRLNWIDNQTGEQHTHYVQQSHIKCNAKDAEEPEMTWNYVVGLALARYFLRKDIDQQILRKGDLDLGTALVFEKTVDYYTQTLKIDGPLPTTGMATRSTRKPYNALVQEYVAAGFQNVGHWREPGVHGHPYIDPRSVTTHQNRQRRSCDRCWLLRVRVGDARCETVGNGSGRCKRCLESDRPCSWTILGALYEYKKGPLLQIAANGPSDPNWQKRVRVEHLVSIERVPSTVQVGTLSRAMQEMIISEAETGEDELDEALDE